MSRFEVAVSSNVDWAGLSAHCHAALKQAMIEAVEMDIAPTARELSAWVTGTNRRSIETDYSETLSSIQVRMFTTSGYGGYIETGTGLAGPYHQRIYPKKGKFLRWMGKDGHWHFARSTAGMAPRPYMYPAYSQHREAFHKHLREIIARYKVKP